MDKKIPFKINTFDDLMGVVDTSIAENDQRHEIDISKISPFPHHPFRVVDDEEMERLVESIQNNGILSPPLVMPDKKGCYIMISGHRRMHAAERAGLKKIPVHIKEMTMDEAVINMVNANIQREDILPSERAFSYKMQMDALKHQGKVLTGTSGHNVLKSDEQIGESAGISGRQVKRYIRLTCLVPEVLEMVDKKKIGIVLGVEVSYLSEKIQKWLYAYLVDNRFVLKMDHVKKIRQYEEDQKEITEDGFLSLMNAMRCSKKKRKVAFTEKKLSKYFPDSYTQEEIEQVMEELLDSWKKKNM